jgi:hypothetical protein
VTDLRFSDGAHCPAPELVEGRGADAPADLAIPRP